MKLFRNYLKLFVVLLPVVFALALGSRLLPIMNKSAPKLLNIDDPNSTYGVEISDDGNICFVSGIANGQNVSKVYAASNVVDLKKYLGQKVKLDGRFVYSNLDAIKDCQLSNQKSTSSIILLEVTKITTVSHLSF